MAWKILTVIAIIVIGGAGYLWYQNHDFTDKQMQKRDKKEATLATRNGEIETEKGLIVDLNKSIADLKDETKKLEADKTDADNTLVQKQSEFSLLVSQEQDKIERRDKFQNIADTGPEIEQLRREISQTRGDIVETSTNIQVKEGVEAATTTENGRLKQIADDLVTLRFNQKNAIISNEFVSRVKEANSRWNFVIVEGGDQRGVVHNAQLDVYRGGQFLCKLLVTEVKPYHTVADIVPGSLPVGQWVKVGDVVRKSPVAPITPPAGSAPKGSAPAGSAPKGSAPQPVPAGGASEPASDPDPFGGSSDDPFGGSDDPFGF